MSRKTALGLANEYAEEAAQGASRAYMSTFERMRKKCQSPIEEMLLAGIISVASGETSFSDRSYTWPEYPRVPFDGVYCRLQAKVGPYRPDFLFIFQYKSKEENKRFLVVECDGHDYHEKTKEQAKHDKSRDRWMTQNNIQLLRYTGSEIYNDSDGCAEEVCALIEKTIYDIDEIRHVKRQAGEIDYDCPAI